jgi:membrane associated rhomboid family serine protease
MSHISKLKEISKYPVITGIAFLAVAVTIAWWTGKSISPLFANAEIRRGQVWRLITSIFPHTDFLHLAFNLYWLWIFGTAIERVYGHSRTLLLILVLAFGSSSFEFALSYGGVGLSGVGYGLFGLLYVLSKHDDRFSEFIDQRTVNLFVGWFVFCIFTTVIHIFSVANVAHAAGAVFGWLLGYAIVLRQWRMPIVTCVAVLILFGLAASTVWRPHLNLASKGGYDEGKWGYDALLANQDHEAIRWLRDAVIYQPRMASYWFDLGIAYERENDLSAAAAAYHRAYDLDPTDPHYADAVTRLR